MIRAPRVNQYQVGCWLNVVYAPWYRFETAACADISNRFVRGCGFSAPWGLRIVE
jgi:hypothetical protein